MLTRRQALVRSAGGIRFLMCLLVLGGAVIALPAEASIIYRAEAQGSGYRVQTSSPDIPIDNSPLDLQLPYALSVNSSIGDVRAVAAYPYPGALVVSVPGTLSGLLGPHGVPSLPSYPALAEASCPVVPRATVGSPGYSLDATCSTERTQAVAASGDAAAAGASATAVTRFDATSTTASAEARSLVQGFTVAGVVGVAASSATAIARAKPGAPAELSSAFTGGEVVIGGQVVVVDAEGMHSPAGSAPVDPSALNAILKHAGVTLHYIGEKRTGSSVTSAGIRITVVEVNPQTGQPMTTVVTLGEAFASSRVNDTGSVPPDVTPGVVLDAPAGTGPASSVAPPLSELVSTGPPAAGQPLPSVAGGDQGSAQPLTVLAAPTPTSARLFFFPVLVLMGLVMTAATMVASKNGWNVSWT